jgi:hypothetical protein
MKVYIDFSDIGASFSFRSDLIRGCHIAPVERNSLAVYMIVLMIEDDQDTVLFETSDEEIAKEKYQAVINKINIYDKQ